METSSLTPKIILLDCDVISHFIASKALNDLPRILVPHQCKVLDTVYSEVAARPKRLVFLDAIIKTGQIQKMPFPEDFNVNKEFARIKSKNPLIGDGERACMAVARFTKDIIATSNFRDVAPYCREFSVLYLGTLDILSLAATKGIYSEQDCDKFIQTAIASNKARFPQGINAIRYYTPKDLSFI